MARSPRFTEYQASTPPEHTVENALWRLKNDPNYFAENALKIQTKGKLKPLVPNLHQKILNNIVQAMRIANLPVRIVILKARRMGMSTDVEALGYQEASLNPYRRSKVVAHTDESARYIFDMTRTFYEEAPADIRPMKRYSTRSELVFENPDEKTRPQNPGLRSRFTVATAGSKEAGRGEEVNFLHLSEVAFYENASNLSAGLLQTVDYAPGTSVFMESTANGVGNYFHDMYWGSKEGKEELISDLMQDYEDIDKLVWHLENFEGNVGYIPIFFSWLDFDEYRLPVSKGEKKYIEDTLDENEKALQELGAGFEQLKWRRAKLDEFRESAEGVSPVDLFKQEYPATDREAFLATGRTVFDVIKLASMKPKNPLLTARVMAGYRNYRKGVRFRPPLMETPYGELKIYKKPEVGHQYALGADVAFAEKGRDFSCIQCLDKETLEHMFEWHGKTVDPDELGRISMMLAWYYNRATVGIERNNMGIASIISLRDSRYPFIYVPKNYATRDAEQPLDRLGWETTSKTKAKAIADMVEQVRRNKLRFNSSALISECLSFKVSENGRLEAEEGKHDDRVMAMAIALQVVVDYPQIQELPTIGQVLHKEKMREALLSDDPAFDKELGDVLP